MLISVPGFPGGSGGEESASSAGDPGFDPWVGKIPWRRKQQPTPVFLPGESHGQRSLVGYSPRGHKESGTTELTDAQAARIGVLNKRVRNNAPWRQLQAAA